MVNVRDGAILVDMYVEPILLEVLGNHLAWLDDSALFGKVLFAENLQMQMYIRLSIPLASLGVIVLNIFG